MPVKTDKKFLIIGLGSMGKRRIRNLKFHQIPAEQIFGFDPSEERSTEVGKEYGIKTFVNFEEAEQEINPDAYIISTPPNLHHQYFLQIAKKKKHFFVEVTTKPDGYQELYPLLGDDFVAAPSCTFRYFPAVKRIKELILSGRIGKPLSFNHYLGQYLPDWHPYEDYKEVYFAKKDTGGCPEMFAYELVWLIDMFSSSVKKVYGLRGKISDLEMTADDIYAATAQFENGIVGNMMIDLINRKAGRTLKIIGTEGTIDWDWLGKKISIFGTEKGDTEVIDLDSGKKVGQYNTGEEAYEAEIGDFLQAVEGKKEFPYTFQEDERILGFLDGFKDL